ncbi:hypothetical protein QR680_005815 [Steinernema hermaphroditum]|uniref:PAX-interacting protein 1 n=1 Tax=Steinernema hermaphroditum TaxID=289476 RepID=A0AA39LW21_9BILA|nr:hypothetical protein QR680_005815 [Steinernema hermaphroditum]
MNLRSSISQKGSTETSEKASSFAQDKQATLARKLTGSKIITESAMGQTQSINPSVDETASDPDSSLFLALEVEDETPISSVSEEEASLNGVLLPVTSSVAAADSGAANDPADNEINAMEVAGSPVREASASNSSDKNVEKSTPAAPTEGQKKQALRAGLRSSSKGSSTSAPETPTTSKQMLAQSTKKENETPKPATLKTPALKRVAASSKATPKSGKRGTPAKKRKRSDSESDEGDGSVTPSRSRISERVETPTTPFYAMNSRRLKVLVALQSLLSDVEVAEATQVIEELGGKVTPDIEEATIFIAREVRRTANMVCAIGKRIPIVSMQWVRESKANGRFLKGLDYLLEDKEHENELNICIERVVHMTVPFLEKWTVCCLPGVKPDPSEVAKLTRCCGGIFVNSIDEMKVSKYKHGILVTKKKNLTHEEKKMLREAKERKLSLIDCSKFFTLVARHSKRAFEAGLSR